MLRSGRLSYESLVKPICLIVATLTIRFTIAKFVVISRISTSASERILNGHLESWRSFESGPLCRLWFPLMVSPPLLGERGLASLAAANRPGLFSSHSVVHLE
uniref:Uncharacterized protein n=1 Tax=Vespula pensylvanica TaxID=30213 RepID=A0A834U9J1_VESPE|nr:hypothetical protein H0235_009100 [Vespula pensylvanica]